MVGVGECDSVGSSERVGDKLRVRLRSEEDEKDWDALWLPSAWESEEDNDDDNDDVVVGVSVTLGVGVRV